MLINLPKIKRVLFLSNPSFVCTKAWHNLCTITMSLDVRPYIMPFFDAKPIDKFPEYDLGLSFLYPYKVPSKEVQSKLWINFHPAPLPELPGRNVAYRAIMGDLKEFGATAHIMNESFDAGPILRTCRFPILTTDIADDLIKKSHEKCLELFNLIIKEILIDKSPLITYKNTSQYQKVKINDYIELNPTQEKLVKALTCGGFYPKIKLNDKTYKIVRE